MSTITEAGYLANLTYDDIVNWTNIATNNSVDEWIQLANGYGVSEYDAVMELAGRNFNFYQAADGTYTISSFNNAAQTVTTSPIDSNVTSISRGNLQTPINRGVDTNTGKFSMSTTPASGSFAQDAKYFIGSVGQAVSAASIGITLGKAIDSALYSANPDYWDSIGLSTLNPATWNSITNGDDSIQAGLFNFLLGLDPNTGQSQAYIDANAFAYLAYALSQNGWFNNATEEQAYYSGNNLYYQNGVRYTQPFAINQGFTFIHENDTDIFTWNITSVPSDCYLFPYKYNNYVGVFAFSRSTNVETILGTRTDYYKPNGSTSTANIEYEPVGNWSTRNGNRYYYNDVEMYMGNSAFNSCFPNANVVTENLGNSNINKDVATIILDGNVITPTNIPGVTNQDNATLPDVSSWTTPQNTLSSLQQQYPSLFSDAIVFDNVQPDGTNPQITYVPITLPNTTNPLETQPTSGTQTQIDPTIDPDTSIQDLIQLVTSLITQPNPNIEPTTDTTSETQQPPQNPTPTGTGSTPPVVAPTGSASALWCIYHPTQAQIDSFGGWLWSTNFVDQLLKIFQNPMDAIISLKKVFVTPVDAGTSTIHAGYLDSGVSSYYVTQQYVSVDCGNVNCYEQFGNVFDYNDTNISLYLPFIGIVPLNTTEVMRSTIHIVYTVDIINGTCLAIVEVNRDGNSAVLYQYSGDASVDYPVSGARSGGLLTGLATAVGAAASIATGGAALPAAGAAVAGVAAMSQKQVQHSGGFSGSAGAMGCKVPYLIIERPQTKVADKFIGLDGYPTNYSGVLGDFSGQVTVSSVHVEGISATDTELSMIETLLKDGVLI